jgi:hypothetical protein
MLKGENAFKKGQINGWQKRVKPYICNRRTFEGGNKQQQILDRRLAGPSSSEK